MSAYELGEKAFKEYVDMRGEAFNTLEYYTMIHDMAVEVIKFDDFHIAQEAIDMDAYEHDAFHAALDLAFCA